MSRGRILLGACALALAAGAVTWALWPDPYALSEVFHSAESQPEPASDAPNVVLVIGCTVRRDQLAPYGGPAEVTPALAALAARGALFEDAVTAAPWTRPSNASLVTGHHALGIGMTEPRDRSNRRVLPEGLTTLAEHLESGGWHTIGLTTNPNTNQEFGFAQGFHRYAQLTKSWFSSNHVVDGSHMVAEVLERVDEAPDDRPVFLQVLLIDAHEPREPPRRAVARFAEPGVPKAVAVYRAALRRFDDAVGALVSGMDTRRHAGRDTLFVVVNDHGEGLRWPDHNRKGHGRFFMPTVVGGVWIAAGPGVAAGHRIEGLASGVDVLPTLLGLLGRDGYAGPGVDHSVALAGTATTTRDRAWVDTWYNRTNRAATFLAEAACQRNYHETRRPEDFPDGCYDRVRDPTHREVRADAGGELELLDAWRAEQHGLRERLGDAPEAELDAAMRAQLEALGYVQ